MITVSLFLSWVLCGLIIGVGARFVLDGERKVSLLLTIVLGITGAVVVGWLFTYVQPPSPAPFSLAYDSWLGWIMGIVGAVAALWGYTRMTSQGYSD